jgi:hypothetical protein
MFSSSGLRWEFVRIQACESMPDPKALFAASVATPGHGEYWPRAAIREMPHGFGHLRD